MEQTNPFVFDLCSTRFSSTLSKDKALRQESGFFSTTQSFFELLSEKGRSVENLYSLCEAFLSLSEGLCNEENQKAIVNDVKTAVKAYKNNSPSFRAIVETTILTDKNKESVFQGIVEEKRAYTKLSQYSNDFDRIVFSSAFRRLQDKAQVFSLEDYDYARTRLTHSIEVSCIAEQLANKLIDSKALVCYPKEDLVQVVKCVSLLHDLGNPPYGHYGEDIIKRFFSKCWASYLVDPAVLNEIGFKPGFVKNGGYFISDIIEDPRLMNDFYHFDGNAQGFRIVTHLQVFDSEPSLDLTASVLSGMIKYPFPSDRYKTEKMGYFFSEQDVIDFLSQTGTFKPDEISVAALIMECADDISYGTSDLDDSVKKGVITYEDILALDGKSDNLLVNQFLNEFKKYYKANKDVHYPNPLEVTIQRMMQKLKVSLISEAAYGFSQIADKPAFLRRGTSKQELITLCPSNVVVEFLTSHLIKAKVFDSKAIVENELEGDSILSFLLEEFTKAVLQVPLTIDNNSFDPFAVKDKKLSKSQKYLSLISSHIKRAYCLALTKGGNLSPEVKLYFRLKMVVDYVSGMTDSYAKKLYIHLLGI